MRDFQRLRAQLRAALLCGPLAVAGCGSSTTPTSTNTTTDNTIGNETTDTTPVMQDVPWPVGRGDCDDGGEWCGPVTQASTAAGSSTADSCPSEFGYANQYFYRNQSNAQDDGQTCCYYWSGGGCGKGRPLVDGGEARVAPVRDGGAWARGRVGPSPADLPAELRERLAQAWLEDALVEHASVASFARATLELMALGAPPELLADCQRAGLDEVRHAEGCFALVERYLGRKVSPGPIEAALPREPDLARLAVDTFLEGCVAETIATLGATRALASCQDPEVARLLRRFVRDETRHAALAWRTVAWAHREGGVRVAAEIHAAARAVAPRGAAELVADPALLAHGRLDARARRDTVHDAWREIIAPTLIDVLGSNVS